MNQSLKSLPTLLLVCILANFAAPYSASADKVFRWTDADGNVHYSSKKPNPGAEPADLPPINRAEVKIPLPNIVSCSAHGGIDCQAGPDKDRSVICTDGFAGATARFRFSCNSPKLSITEILEKDQDGQVKVFVRNSKSVAASKPALFYKAPDNGHEQKLDGPKEIEAFGIAEFVLKLDHNQKPSLEQLRLTCANCP